MNERATNLLEQYDIEVAQIRKGRGSFICEEKDKNYIFKEYTGSEERLAFQDYVLSSLINSGFDNVEAIVRTKEDGLYVSDADQNKYILKTYFHGHECDSSNMEQCIEIVKLMARLHLYLEKITIPNKFFADRNSRNIEFEKHNREIKKVRRYIKQKSQKNRFEINLLNNYQYFMDNAFCVAEESKKFEEANESSEKIFSICHGDYQYHNVLFSDGAYYIVNFEKIYIDDPVRDLHLLMRKLMEKNNWDIEYGKKILDAYEEVRPLSQISKKDLYYRLLYPEKFWKIINFYYNSSKYWIPDKNVGKLEKLISLENSKKLFIENIFE